MTGEGRRLRLESFLSLPSCRLPPGAEAACSICHEDFRSHEEAKSLPCAAFSACPSHYHAVCLRVWLERQLTCPLCRRSFEDELGVPRDVLVPLAAAPARSATSSPSPIALTPASTLSIADSPRDSDEGAHDGEDGVFGIQPAWRIGGEPASSLYVPRDFGWVPRGGDRASPTAEPLRRLGEAPSSPSRPPPGGSPSRSPGALQGPHAGRPRALGSPSAVRTGMPWLQARASQRSVGPAFGRSLIAWQPGGQPGTTSRGAVPRDLDQRAGNPRPQLFTRVESLDLDTRRLMQRRVAALHSLRGQR